tara:strand:- start:450 stop:2090 length:1641 start_codon:yes stop_codon:yes gene_type:complete
MSQINQLLESAAGSYKNLQSDAARLSSKWDKTGLLEGLKNEAEKNNMSMILENQAKQLVTEISADGGAPAPAGAASFSANVGTGAQWAGIALPLVRKVFGQIAAKEFVSVQPMNLPSGLVFYLDFQYGSTKNSDTNTSPERFTAGDSLYGGSDTPFSTDGNAGEGLYGPGRFGYSMNSQSNGDLIFSAATASWKEVGFDSDLSASVAADEVIKITFANANTQLVQPDLESIRGWAFVSASAVSGGQVNAYNTALGNTVTMYVSGAEGTIANGTTGTVYYGTQPEDNTLGDFENTSAIPEINIGMRSEAIVAKTRKLKAVWTPEFAQDLNAYQSLDAEAEVTNIMSEYISLEIDSEILAMLIQDASAGTEYWSAQNNRFYVSGDDFTNDTNGYFNTQGQWFQTLGTKVNKLSNEIHRLTLRGGANFMVVSPTVSTILESIPGFAADNSDAEKMEYAFGIQKAGSFNGRYKVYKNPYMKENTVLLGYRGSQFLESGAVFAPYVPLIMTPLVYDPDTFVPRKGLLTRYAKKMLRPEFYGKIYISGLNTL